jgi:hypothetical protein
MASGFRALRHEDVSSGFRGVHRFGNFPCRVHDFGPDIVRALKIFPQVLVFACPGKGDDRRSSAQGDREHILLNLKQQMIDAERFFGSLTDRSDLAIEGCGVECRRAERAEAAGVGYGGDQRRGGCRAHSP